MLSSHNLSRTFIVIVCLVLIVATAKTQNGSFVKGADGSLLDQVEQSGGFFFEDGEEKDAYEIFKKHGINNIRLKLWHTPAEPYNNLARVKAMAKRAKEAGLGITLDFHFSDTWADPGHQTKPASWNTLQFSTLADSVRQYTRNVVSQLKSQNTLPEYIQIGNEISCGMLWPEGNVCDPDSPEQWNKLGLLIKNAIQGVNESLNSSDEVKIIIHFGNGGDKGASQWFYDGIAGEGIDYDIIGVSFYPWWHGTLTDLQNNLNNLAIRYGKDVMVVESGYPWTLEWNDNTNNIVGSTSQLLDGYPATVEGQYTYIRDLIETIKSTPSNHGTGIMYWSPEWIAAPNLGSPWENIALFDFDNEVLESIKAFDDNTGTDENKIIDPVEIIVTPNPVKQDGEIYIRLKQNKIIELSLLNTNGKTMTRLYSGKLNSEDNRFSINWNQFSPGLYFIHLKTEQSTIQKKIIITN